MGESSDHEDVREEALRRLVAGTDIPVEVLREVAEHSWHEGRGIVGGADQ